MKKLAWVLTTAVLAWIAMLIVIGVRGYYEYTREIGSFWDLADRASTIPQKAHYIDNFVAALESQGFDGEHNAVLFPTPENSFDKNLEALKSLQGRLREIEKMDVTSFQYQTAIQQITAQEQGEAGAMLNVFSGVWWKRRHFIVWDWMVLVHVAAASLVGLFTAGLFLKAYDQW